MNVRLIIQKGFVAVLAAMALGSCDVITEDRDACPTGLYVTFVYDYNIQRADMLKDHVGGLTLYVYDESDRLVVSKSMSGNQLSKYGSYLHFTEGELAPGHDYRLMAVAFQTENISANGAKYRLTGNSIGAEWQQFCIDLDHDNGTRGSEAFDAAKRFASPTTAKLGSFTHYYYVSNAAPLDTLWHTLATYTTPADSMPKTIYPDMLTPARTDYRWQRDGSIKSTGVERVHIVKDEPTYATVSLIRDTKHLNISLREIDHPERTSHEDYDVFIVDNNGTLDCQNNLVNTDDTLVYTPYAQWTTAYDGEGTIGEQRSAHYDLMFNRLMHSTTPADCAVLCIRRKSDGKDIALLNLPEVLSEGRTAFEIFSYTPQEYLDREYDYRLELFLKGEEWQQLAYLYVCIDVLSWAKRIQYVQF